MFNLFSVRLPFSVLVFVVQKTWQIQSTGSLQDGFTTQRNNIWEEASICMNLLRRYGWEMWDAIVCWLRNHYQSDQTILNTNTWRTNKWSWMMASPCGPTLWALFSASVFYHKINWCSTFTITIKVNSLHLQLSLLIKFQGSHKAQAPSTLAWNNPLSPTDKHSQRAER